MVLAGRRACPANEGTAMTGDLPALDTRTLMQSVPGIILLLDSDARIVECNEATAEYLAQSHESLIGVSIHETAFWTKGGGLCCLIARAVMTPGVRCNGEHEFVRPDGRHASIIWTCRSVLGDDGSVRGTVCVGTDITHHRDLHRQLSEREAQLSAVIDAIPDLMFHTRANGDFLSYHADSDDLLAVSPDKIKGGNIHSIGLPDEVVELAMDVIHRALSTGEMQFAEYNLATPRGEGRFEMRMVPIADDEVLCIVRDITQRYAAEEEREHLITELREALTRVHTLHGMLPICASCKKIRDDAGYWNQIEEYVSKRTDAEFTHGLCPDCMQQLYPEYAERIAQGE